jgi:hypothetical protein
MLCGLNYFLVLHIPPGARGAEGKSLRMLDARTASVVFMQNLVIKYQKPTAVVVKIWKTSSASGVKLRAGKHRTTSFDIVFISFDAARR